MASFIRRIIAEKDESSLINPIADQNLCKPWFFHFEQYNRSCNRVWEYLCTSYINLHQLIEPRLILCNNHSRDYIRECTDIYIKSSLVNWTKVNFLRCTTMENYRINSKLHEENTHRSLIDRSKVQWLQERKANCTRFLYGGDHDLTNIKFFQFVEKIGNRRNFVTQTEITQWIYKNNIFAAQCKNIFREKWTQDCRKQLNVDASRYKIGPDSSIAYDFLPPSCDSLN